MFFDEYLVFDVKIQMYDEGVSLLRSSSEGSAIPVTKRMKPAHTHRLLVKYPA